jgi:hypothetical protein
VKAERCGTVTPCRTRLNLVDSFLLALGVVALMMDGIVTVLVLARGAFELNPVLRLLIRKTGLRTAVIWTRVIVLGLLLTLFFSENTALLMVAVGVPTSAAILTLVSFASTL